MNKPEMRPCLREIQPYVPGKPIQEVKRELGLDDVVKMASNENPLGPSPQAVEAMREHAEMMHYYPDGSCYELKLALAAKYGFDPGQFIFGSGSDELLTFLVLTYLNPGEETVMVAPSFSEYLFATRLMGGVPRQVPLQGEDFAFDLAQVKKTFNEKTRLVFICSPNNPSGTIIDRNVLGEVLESLPPRALVVLDQAYIEYVSSAEHPSGLEEIAAGKPVIALRTFSKIYGLAGLRIGYGIAAPEVISEMNHVREPFNVNAMAQAAALAALQDDEHLRRSREAVAAGRQQLTAGLAELGLQPVADEANFFFVNLGVDSVQAFQGLLRRGVIVRTGDIFGYPTYLRVTYGREEENTRFLKALQEVLAELR